MAKPVILTVDDDPEVLRAVERDLRKRYGDRYRVLSTSSGQAGLDLLKKIEQRNEPVALFLVDHRMPHMNGIEFLAQAMKLYPDPKRVLLTAYADTDAAIRAINEVKLHHYLLKPWDPPESGLYPVLDDLLEDWQASFRPAFQGVRVLGSRWAPKSYEMREFLARNHVPYQWIDVEVVHREPDIRKLVEGLGKEEALPVVVFEDGTRMPNPTPGQVGDRVGLHTKPVGSFFDLAIIGGGPAGLAAVYGASEGLKTRHRGTRLAWGSGRIEFTDRELPGIPDGVKRQRSGAAGGDAGAAFWRRDRIPAGSQRNMAGRSLPRDHAQRRRRNLGARGGDRKRGAVAQAGRSRDGAAGGRGRVLRRRFHGSALMRGRARLHSRRSQFGRPGRHEFCAVCQ